MPIDTLVFLYLFEARNSRVHILAFKILFPSSSLFPFSILKLRSSTNATGQLVASKTTFHIYHRNGYSTPLYLYLFLCTCYRTVITHPLEPGIMSLLPTNYVIYLIHMTTLILSFPIIYI